MAKVSLRRLVVMFTLACLPFALCAPKERQQNNQFPGGCNFDSKQLCSWHQSKNDDFDWTLTQGKTPSSGTGPAKDYSGSGYYAYIETSSPRRMGQKARLMGGPFSGAYCLRFAYNMNGNSIGQLNIIHYLDHELNIWYKKGDQGQNWKTDNATVYGNNYYVIFEGIVGDSYTGDTAIDDIHFVKGTCHGEPIPEDKETANKDFCDFDLGLCDWANDLIGAAKGAGESTKWRLTSYRGPSTSETSRPTDHGKKYGGKYVYAERKSRARTKTKARLVSHKMCGTKCVELFYFTRRFVTTKSELRLSARINGKEDRLWFTNGAAEKQNEPWKRAVVDVKAENETCFEVVFETVLAGNRNPLVGLDDILIANGSCCPMMNTPKESAKANCDFDKGTLCNWRHSVKSSFPWSFGSGETKSGQESGGLTGPTKDASGKGQYAYIESSEPHMSGDKAVLVSDVMAGQQCMQFKYHMHGEDTGSLSIYRRGIRLWKESGNHGNQWLQGQVDLDCKIPEYQIEIEATVVGWRGDIAIDELQFTSGKCSNKTNATAVITKPIIPPILPPPIYSTCTFSKNLCSWSNALNDDGDWKIYSDHTPSFQTGPAHDHDADGYYIYMEASDLLEGNEVRLESKEFRMPICLSFNYYMFGQDVKELRLEQTNLTDNTTKVIWSKTGEQGDDWQYGSQTISGEKYTVSFVAVRGKSYLSDIALDTISVNDVNRCDKVHIYGAAKKAVKEGNCDFENGTTSLCQWCNARKGDKFDWTRQSKRTPSSGTGPNGDHTKGYRGNGYYIYIETSSPRRGKETAVLLLKLGGRATCMRFWYHMNGGAIGSLKIMHHVTRQTEQSWTKERKTDAKQCDKLEEEWPKKSGTEVWSKERNQGDKWMEAEVFLDVDRSFGPFSVHWLQIIGEVGGGWAGDIAVDDIDFTSGRCSSRRSKN